MAEAALPRRRPRSGRCDRRRGRGDRGPGRLPGARCGHLQLRRGARGRPGSRRLPQGPASQLRRLRRAPLLRAGRHPGADRGRGGAGRADDLRGHLVPGAARLGRGARRREPDRQSLRLAVPPRTGDVSGADGAGPGPGNRGRVRGLQSGRRPGRAGLRRTQRGRLGAGPNAGSRGPVRRAARAVRPRARRESSHRRAARRRATSRCGAGGGNRPPARPARGTRAERRGRAAARRPAGARGGGL